MTQPPTSTVERRTRPLLVGERTPLFRARAQNGQVVDQDSLFGQYTIVYFYPRDGTPGCTAEACAFRDAADRAKALGVRVIGVSTDSVETHVRFTVFHQLRQVLLADPQGQLADLFGISLRRSHEGRTIVFAPRLTYLFNPNGRVARIYSPQDPATHPSQVLDDVEAILNQDPPRAIVQHAPVLVLPDVLPPRICSELMRTWQDGGNDDSGFVVTRDGKTVGVYDYEKKIRRDHFLAPGPLKAAVCDAISFRVRPEIRRAFSVNVTHFEDFRIACYDATRGGFFRPHRDNTTPGTAHRRFAMTLNLNTGEYEGGALRFPEFGPHLYAPPPGGAVVFSCSLLHEATDLIRGRRFALLSFLYTDEDARKRDEYARTVGYGHGETGRPMSPGNAAQTTAPSGGVDAAENPG